MSCGCAHKVWFGWKFEDFTVCWDENLKVVCECWMDCQGRGAVEWGWRWNKGENVNFEAFEMNWPNVTIRLIGGELGGEC